MIETIKSTFLNYNTKMRSPDFVIPEDTYYKKEVLLNSFININNELIKAVQLLKLNKLCTSFEIPVFGFLTRLESIHFVLFHTRQHIHQLENITNKLK